MRKALADRKASIGQRRMVWSLALTAVFSMLWFSLLRQFALKSSIAASTTRYDAGTEPRLAALIECMYDEEQGERVCIAPDVQLKVPWNIYLAPQDNPGKGWRFFHLISQGLDMHPYLTRVHALAQADAVLWLPTSTNNAPTGFANSTLAPRLLGVHGSPRLVVLDEGDHHGFYPPVAKLPYLAYFKRSWIHKRDGTYLGPGKRLPRAFYPLPYAASDRYHPPPREETYQRQQGGPSLASSSRRFEGLAARLYPLVSSLRCDPKKQPTRCKILNWTTTTWQQFAESHSADRSDTSKQGLDGGGRSGTMKQPVLGEVNHGGRKEINANYFATMRQARIVVTCNPSHWEGDFRLFEAMMSGALVFVDEMFAPSPHPLVHLKHVVVYSTSDPGAFSKQLLHFLTHPLEARAIARRGYLHTLKYHRAVSRVDYFLRTAHDQELHEASGLGGSARDAKEAKQSLKGGSLESGLPSASHALAREDLGHRYLHTGRSIHKDAAHAMLAQPPPKHWQ